MASKAGSRPAGRTMSRRLPARKRLPHVRKLARKQLPGVAEPESASRRSGNTSPFRQRLVRRSPLFVLRQSPTEVHRCQLQGSQRPHQCWRTTARARQKLRCPPQRSRSRSAVCSFDPRCTLAKMPSMRSYTMRSYTECLHVPCQFWRLRDNTFCFSHLGPQWDANCHTREGKSYTSV